MIEPEALPPIILASTSPRRKELLESAGLSFRIIPPNVDEAALDTSGMTPVKIVEELARLKAEDVAKDHPGHLVIGSDTVVVVDTEVLGKPEDKADAKTMLKRLQNRSHQVISGIAVCYQGQCVQSHRTTHIEMDPMTDDEIERYVNSGEPMDKAGAYAIQGYASVYISRIDGCYFNVVGMSLNLVHQMIQQMIASKVSP